MTFERHAALERLVLGFVDDAHAAAADLAEQGVVAQPPRAAAAGRPARRRRPASPDRPTWSSGVGLSPSISSRAGKSSRIRAACSG